MSESLDMKLHEAIELLNDEQKKAVLDLIKAFVTEDSSGSHWDDEDFVKEMDDRYAYYKSGGKMVTPEELKEMTSAIFEKARAK